MVEVQDPVLIDRENEFIPDEISFLNFVVSDYSNPTLEDSEKDAENLYDEETEKLV